MWKLIQRIHNDEKGAVSIETVLILAAIAIPVLIFILKFAWPQIVEFFNKGMDDLESGSDSVTSGAGTN